MEIIMICRHCNGETILINDFGQMPIANAFTRTVEEDSFRFHLTTSFCGTCKLFQLNENPKVQQMFHGAYPFFTSTSKTMIKHFSEFYDQYKPNTEKDPFVLEIGSNDGSLLIRAKNDGFRHLGVDPSGNVVERAREQGINAISEFFTEKLAQTIETQNGKANRIFAANVICHIPDLHDLAKGIKSLLAPDGLFVFEEPYLGSMLAKTSYDQIYDEHIYIFSGSSIQKVFSQYGLELIDLQEQITHGGSMRYVIAHEKFAKPSNAMIEVLENEERKGFNSVEAYLAFGMECEKKRMQLKEIILELSNRGKRIAGYGATSKSTTILNYCQIGNGLIEYICDTTPEKQGRLTPGSHIPVISREEAQERLPDYFILFAWNHAAEIMALESERMPSKVEWISIIPKIEIVPK